ncbi:MAG: glycerophosphodiester phosphodiesterase [Alphaproteobacteria bacterium]|nr:glycerophosphodiester phosphodiesterase [Alphaproteobacteria bacterium]
MSRPAKHAFLDHSGLLAFAHRGGAHEAPENTMRAFDYAVGLGYRYLETDAYATRDGVLISFHDDRLDRVTDAQGKIEELTWAQLETARIGGKEPIPRLEELLTRWADVRINIDPKHDAAVAPLIALIKRLGIEDRVCIGSFSGKRIAQVQDAFDGKVCTSLGPSGVLKLKGASAGLPVGRFREGCAQVPVKANGVTIVTRRFVEAAERAGLQVHVWTIDDAPEMNRLIDIGVHGLMTDRPGVLKDVLIVRGLWN